MNRAPEIILSDSTGEILYWPKVWPISLFEELDRSLVWKQDKIKIYGRDIKLPRLTAWYGDPEASYSYSGIQNSPLPWTVDLISIRKQAEAYSQSRFNAVLANRYADGGHYQGYHADNEEELGSEPVIASASFGGTRRFLIKEKESVSQRRFEIALEDGSLLIMRGKLQEHFVHAIAKTKKAVEPRINLTFRRIFTRDRR